MKNLALVLLFVPLAAFAGKEEREYMKSDVTPAITAAQGAFKSGCGCDLKMVLDEASVKSKDDMYQIKHMAESVAEGAPKHCTDAESKKAICKMKTLKMAKAKESTFSFAGAAGTATTDGQSYTSWDMIARELDK
jgi:hypothetical protein